jgi:hypothetical protein
MTKHGVLSGRIDLDHFFEASVDAVQDDSGSTETGNRANLRTCAQAAAEKGGVGKVLLVA